MTRIIEKVTALITRQIKEGRQLLLLEHPYAGIQIPAGTVEAGETPEQAAVRECRDELHIEVSNLEYCGEHRFQFVDGYSIHVWVYRTRVFTGVPTETPEAEPLWTQIDNIPYDLMWEDDRHWLPMLIRGEKFQTRWIFDGDRMVDYLIEPDGKMDSWAGRPFE